MKTTLQINLLFICSLVAVGTYAQESQKEVMPKSQTSLFNGKDLTGWEGDAKVWRVEKRGIVGGNKKDMQPQNEFLSTTSIYHNFDLQLKFKIKGYSGFINAGVQFHSERLTNPAHEMKGFQADIGSDCMGSLYDESRRDKYLSKADQQKIKISKGWNTYRIVAKNNIITLFINGTQTTSYKEEDAAVPLFGKIALQIHGGGVLEVFYKDIKITLLE